MIIFERRHPLLNLGIHKAGERSGTMKIHHEEIHLGIMRGESMSGGGREYLNLQEGGSMAPLSVEQIHPDPRQMLHWRWQQN